MRQPDLTQCPAGEELRAFADGELDGRGRAEIQAHLEACPTCAEEVEEMRTLWTELRALEGAVEPPATLRTGVLSRLRFRPDPPRFRFSLYEAARWAAVGVPTAAALVVAGSVIAPQYAARQERAAGKSANVGRAAQAPSAAQSMPPPASGPAAEEPATRSAPGGAAAKDAEANQRDQALWQEGSPAASPPAANAVESSDRLTFEDGHARGRRMAQAGEFKRENGDPYGAADYDQTHRNLQVQTLPKGPNVTPEDVKRYTRGTAIEEFRRKVVQTADLSVRVSQRLESVQDTVAERVKKEGGYLENSSLAAPESGERTSSMVLRVPVEKFEATVAWLATLGEVKTKNIRGEDVTGTWIDQRAEVRELRAEEARLAKQYRDAKTSGQREAARWALLRVRPRIAASEERFALTGKLAALATVRLTLTEEPQARVRGNLLRDLDGTTRAAVAAFMVAIRVPAALLIWLAIFAPLWLPCVLVYRWATRMSRAERKGSVEPLSAE